MDRYDLLILHLVKKFREQSVDRSRIKLQTLERDYWKALESESGLQLSQGRIGERIARLYVSGYIENKNGYAITRRGRLQLEATYADEV